MDYILLCIFKIKIKSTSIITNTLVMILIFYLLLKVHYHVAKNISNLKFNSKLTKILNQY